MVSKSQCLSKISMIGNAPLVMFYCTYFMKDNIYYLQDSNAITIVEYDGNTLYLQDVFCTEHISIDYVIEHMANEQTQKVVFGVYAD